MYFIKSIFLLFFISQACFSYALNLSQKSVVKTVLKNSLEYQKIKLQEKITEQNLINSEAFLDWHLFTKAQLNTKEQTTLDFFEIPSQKSWSVVSGIEKKFLTGSYISMQYSYLELEQVFTPEFEKISSSPKVTFQQKIKLEVEQDILRNIFGYADKMKLNIAQTQAEAENLKLLEKAENLILQAIKQFWSAYTSFLSLKLKIEKKKDYGNLTRITKNKNKFGYVKPGELHQIQAEWEKAKQDLVLQEIHYKDQIKKLLDLLNIPQQQQNEVYFTLNQKLSSPPDLNKNLVQSSRKVLLLKKNLSVQQQKLKVQKSNAWPTLKLFGSYEIGGYDTDFSSSFKGLSDIQNTDHSFGIKFSYPLPATRVRQKRLAIGETAVLATELQTKITEKEFNRLIDITQKNLLALYSALKSSQKIHHLRVKSYKEVRKAFLQGRLSVFELISAKEFSLTSEMEKVKLKAQYHQALAYAQAVRDQLIMEYQ